MSYQENSQLIDLVLKSSLPRDAKRVLMSVISFTEPGEWLCKVPRDLILSRAGVSDKPGRRAFAVLAEMGLVSPPIACNVPMRQIHRGKIAQLKEGASSPENERLDQGKDVSLFDLLRAVSRSGLKAGPRVVLLTLINLTREEQRKRGSDAPMEEIVRISGFSRPTAQKYLRELVGLGLVLVESRANTAIRTVVEGRVLKLGDALKGEPLFN